MQKTLKIFLSIALMFTVFSCEQHFFYLKKVPANSSISKIENHDKNIHHSATSHFKSDLTHEDSNQILSKNTSSDDFLTASVDTPKPYIIKKLPVVEEEYYNSNKREETPAIQKPKEQKFPFKILLGIFLVIISVICFIGISNYRYRQQSYYSGGYSGNLGCSEGCSILLLEFLGIASLLSGLALVIIGFIQY